MRFLPRPDPPPELTEAIIERLTSEFLLDPSKTVWRRSAIESALLAMSSHKCAYCEAKLGVRSMYMEVDHFFHKRKYPNKVVDWSNLLPACKHCNTSKSDHDVGESPIIDPSAIDPRLHIRLTWYRFEGIDSIGQSTVDVLDLNDRERNMTARFLAGEAIQQGLDDLHQDFRAFELSRTVSNRNRMLRRLRQLLKEAGPAADYGSTSATILFDRPVFLSIRQKLEELGLWTEELRDLHQSVQLVAYRSTSSPEADAIYSGTANS